MIRLLRSGVARVVVEPVRTGRIRDVGWPSGFAPVVLLAGVVYGVAAVLVVASGPIRAGAELTTAANDLTTLPAAWTWPVVAVVLVALALFQTAVLHAPGWLRALGTVATLLVVGSWGLRSTGLDGSGAETIGTVVIMVGLVALVVLRARRPFAWWEFPVVWLLVTVPVVLGMEALNHSGRPLGFEQVPVYLQSTVTTLGPFAIPAAVAAGLSVAEITVSATLWATRTTSRHATSRLSYAILAGLLALRLGQVGWQLVHWDFVRQGARVFLTWSALVAVLAGLAALLLRLGASREGIDLPVLPERMATLALPVGLGVAGLGLVSVALVSVFGIVGGLAPLRVGAMSSRWLAYVSSPVVAAVYRVVVSGLLVALALRAARRGRRGTALLLAAVAVTLGATTVRVLSRGVLDPGLGADAVNLIATAILVGVVVVLAVRRSLTPDRAAALSGAVVLTALLGYRDFVSDPLGTLLGFSGAALVLFGLTWSLLTDSGYANSGSPRYPVPTRVMLTLANSILALGILAYTSLARDPEATIDLGEFATYGDQVLGTALLAAAFIAVLDSVRRPGNV